MGSFIDGGVASAILIIVAFLRSTTYITTSSAIVLTLILLVAGNVVLKISKTLISPCISPLRDVPGPKGNHVFFGQALKIFKTPGPNDLYIQWMKKWPSAHFIRHLSFGNAEVLLVNSLEAHREVMQTKAHSFVKPKFFEKLLGEFLGRGVLFSVGAEHRLQRRFLAGPFSTPNIRRLLPIFQEKARDLSSFLERSIESDARGNIEIESAYIKATLDIVGATILGIELSKLKSSSASPLNFEECYHHILEQSFLGWLIAFANGFVPLRWLPLAANQKFLRANTAVWSMVRELVHERFEQVEARQALGVSAGGKKSEDLLTYMIEANLSSDDALSREQIVEDMLQFIIAGHETSAGSLTWTTYALATNPSIQDRLRKEILSATRTGNKEIDYAAIESMRFLNNVLRESIRLYSPSLTLPREAAEDMVVGDVHIPKGTTVTMVPAMVQRNPLIWGEDADVFNPDRWDTLTTDSASPYAISAFSGGPRVCVGRSFAYLEMKAILVELLSKFVFEPADSRPKLLNPAVTLKPKGGLKVNVLRAV
ncbi:cytochrome P450 [Cadophora sp. MPI-SDFR-AT-0126]|nr:cytochrome P450 [Leotiomycetes sp. MPI-SDFR-AT-0126]